MRPPKQVILDALDSELAGVEDDFARMKMLSQGMPKDEAYGLSRRTSRQILGGLIGNREEVKNAIIWANTL